MPEFHVVKQDPRREDVTHHAAPFGDRSTARCAFHPVAPTLADAVARALYCASMSTGPSPAEQYPAILTTAQASQLLAVHVEYLRKMVREGRIPAHRFPEGREIRFLRDELIAWVAEQPGHDRSPSADKSDEPKPKRVKKSASHDD